MEGRLPCLPLNLYIVILVVISLAIHISAQTQGWGPWKESGHCTRTCGGGVQKIIRRCLSRRSSRSVCQGRSQSYRTCNAKECPQGSLGFREYQCYAFNSVDVFVNGRMNQTYTWRPYFESSSPCRLTCQNEHGEIKKLREYVVDGTRCDHGNRFGVCIEGICKTTGCDHRLGSSITEDKCLVCGSRGENCDTKRGSSLNINLNPRRETELLTFPEGATSIQVNISSHVIASLELQKEDDELLKLIEVKSNIMTGGRWKMKEFAGTKFRYEKKDEVHIFDARGPINNRLALLVRFKGMAPMIGYEYSTQRVRVQPTPKTQRLYWTSGQWSQCSTTCGMGYKQRSVNCVGIMTMLDQCDERTKPINQQTCNMGPCSNHLTSAYRWEKGSWGKCNVNCGIGEQVQNMYCVEDGASGTKATVNDNLCQRYVGKRPVYQKACLGGDDECPYWAAASWTTCSVSCGYGTRKRKVYCQRDPKDEAADPVVLTGSMCQSEKKPETQESCYRECTEETTTSTTPRPSRRVPCRSTRYGCCPDRVTAAKGSYYRGCPDVPERRRHCRNSRYGCCRDGVSYAKGDNYEGCPDVISGQEQGDCGSSQFGCCPDRSTPAAGENFKGCPGTTPVSKKDLCEKPSSIGKRCKALKIKWYYNNKKQKCMRFWYGGCEGNANRFDTRQDCMRQCQNKDLNPEGCATSVFGCCSDGKSFARGANKAGCPETRLIGGCAGTQHGCCDDGFTSARGPQKAGCPETRPLVGGCAGTRHGCCRDGKTAATGPAKEGCPELKLIGGCRGTRYGCCKDGVTAARGDKYLGCAENPILRCHQTQYGCCDDRRTPATGPNKQGCPDIETSTALSCTSSTYGCCPDGVTFATGYNKAGCAEFDQATCGLSKDPGGCGNYAKKFFYSSQFGVCRQFWYGGCKGNGNRFDTQGECEQKCIHVSGTAICRLPVVKGPCKAKVTRFHYDHKEGACKTFTFSGCHGNTNNFKTIGECQTACNGKVATQGTQSPCVNNPCQNLFQCQDHSGGKYSCSCNPDWGKNCETAPPYWCFGDNDCGSGLRCLRERLCDAGNCHVYARCAASSRRHICETKQCPSNQDCVLDGSSKDGYFCMNKVRNPRPSAVILNCTHTTYGCCWDGRTPANGPRQENCPEDCRTGRYGCCPDGVSMASGPDYYGCDDVEGSGNVPCENTRFGCCDDGVTSATGPRKQGCEDTTDNERVTRAPPRTRPPIKPDTGSGKCTAPFPRRECKKYVIKWRYNPDKRRCERGWWGGCGDNGNVFDKQIDCQRQCRGYRPQVVETTTPEPDLVHICDMPKETGPCRASITRFYYDARDKRCKTFTYGGCRGNDNNFKTVQECMKECIKQPVPTTTTVAPTQQTRRPQTRAPQTPAPRTRATVRFYGSSVDEYEQLRLTCLYNGEKNVRFDWYKGENRLSQNSRMHIVTSPRRLDDGKIQIRTDIVIQSATMADEGTYECRTSTELSQSKTIRVNGSDRPKPTPLPTPRPTRRPLPPTRRPPPSTRRPPPSTRRPTTRQPSVGSSISMSAESSVRAGETLTVMCVARGPRRPTSVEWFINGRLVNPTVDKASITNRMDRNDRTVLISELNIDDATDSDEGVYYCRSRPYGKLDKMAIKVVTRRVEPVTTRRPSTAKPEFLDVCPMPKESGNCLAFIPRWYYNSLEGRCMQFDYGGCGGNRNNFETESECNNFCHARDICFQSNIESDCVARENHYYFHKNEQRCLATDVGNCDYYVNYFKSMEACERKCQRYINVTKGVTDGPDVCGLVPEKGNCNGYNIKWYYSRSRNQCARFIYTGCDGNENRFDTEDDCRGKCMGEVPATQRPVTRRPVTRRPVTRRPVTPRPVTPRPVTRRPVTRRPVTRRPVTPRPDPITQRPPVRSTPRSSGIPAFCFENSNAGTCYDYKIKWYYDESNRQCVRFYYGGCNGNDNRFETKRDCQEACQRVDVRPVTRRPVTQRPVTRWPVTRRPVTQRPRPVLCQNSRYGCCDDGRTTALNRQRSNCPTPRPVTSRPIPVPCQYSTFGCCIDGRTTARDIQRSNCRVVNDNYNRVMASTGSDVLLQCSVQNSDVTWYREGYLLSGSQKFNIYNNGSLILRELTEDMAGSYACRIGMVNNVAQLERFKVEISVPLRIIRGPSQVNPIPGSNVYLHCQATGNPTPKVSWKRDGRPLKTTTRHRVFGNGTLTITNIYPADEGQYQCIAENGASAPVSRITTLMIKESIQAVIDRHPGVYYEGDTITLKCKASGYPEPLVEWVKDNRTISNENRRTSRNGELVVRSASIEDAGIYKCTARNDKSYVMAFTSVRINPQSPKRSCSNTMSMERCRIIVASGLCSFKDFALKCCNSCRKARFL